jgi:DegV family protein with EDD domain
MSRVRIVTDSTIRFSNPSFLDRYDIVLAPITVHYGTAIVEDGPDADLREMRRLSENCRETPTTSPPSPEYLARIYTQLQSKTDQILSIHTSSGLSNIVTNANIARQQFLGRLNIQVIDSQTTSIGLGLLVQAASEAAARGENLDTLVHIVRGMIPRLYMVFFLDDLFYLEQNNLISRSQAILGNMLGIVPFLTMEEGRMIPMEKVRSRSRAIEKLIEFVCEFTSVEHLAILQSKTSPSQESLSIVDRLRAFYPSIPISTTCYGPIISMYVGLNSIGVAVLETKESAS